jgi:glycerate dehydrogenase
MNKIVILDGYTLNPGDLSWEELKAFGDVTVHDRTRPDQVLARASDCTILMTNKTILSGETLRSLPSVKYIGVLATGYNVMDIAVARELGITVTNIPAYGTFSVAQMVFAHLLEICHHAGAHNEAVKAGDWSRSGDFCFWNYPLIELSGKTLGIIGLGRIGQAVARIALAFGMEVIASDPVANKEDENQIRMTGIGELLEQSDVISLHCPLTEETRGIINRQTLSQMKDGVILINTARGQLIVEEDLAKALASGKVAAAGLDVLQTEPPPDNHPLLALPNCHITPHIAWAPKEARSRLMAFAVENIRSFLEGKPINVVN